MKYVSGEIVRAWEEGTLSDLEALRYLCRDLGEVESELEPLAAERDQLREIARRMVARLDGQKAMVAGFGVLAITEGGESVSYDAKALDALTAELLQLGDAYTASRIAAARKMTRRASSLRITRDKAK